LDFSLVSICNSLKDDVNVIMCHMFHGHVFEMLEEVC
jgi:hypothetical protein